MREAEEGTLVSKVSSNAAPATIRCGGRWSALLLQQCSSGCGYALPSVPMTGFGASLAGGTFVAPESRERRASVWLIPVAAAIARRLSPDSRGEATTS